MIMMSFFKNILSCNHSPFFFSFVKMTTSFETVYPCPICSLLFTSIEVDVHVNSHFEQEQKVEAEEEEEERITRLPNTEENFVLTGERCPYEHCQEWLLTQEEIINHATIHQKEVS